MVVAFLFSCTPYLSLVESTFLRSHCATPPCGPTVLCAKVSLSTCRRSNFGLPRYGFHNRSPQSETGIGDGGRCTSHPGGGGATRHTILRVAIVCHPHTHGTGLWDIVLVHPQHTGVPAHTGIAWCVCGSDTSHVMSITPMSTPPTARTAPTGICCAAGGYALAPLLGRDMSILGAMIPLGVESRRARNPRGSQPASLCARTGAGVNSYWAHHSKVNFQWSHSPATTTGIGNITKFPNKTGIPEVVRVDAHCTSESRKITTVPN